MRHFYVEPIFENRHDAGRKLAERLYEYANKSVIVLGIPNGGVAVALSVALALNADLDLVISRKIPLPLNPESGFGSVTDDGTMILNEEVVKRAGLTNQQINYQVSQVRAGIRNRSLLYHADRPPLTITGRTVIIVDDGLASGYTMRAAIKSVHHRNPDKVIAAAPVGPEHVVRELQQLADRVVTCATGTGPVFAVADYYRNWYDVTEEEVLQYLKEWRMRRYGIKIDIPERKQESV